MGLEAPPHKVLQFGFGYGSQSQQTDGFQRNAESGPGAAPVPVSSPRCVGLGSFANGLFRIGANGAGHALVANADHWLAARCDRQCAVCRCPRCGSRLVHAVSLVERDDRTSLFRSFLACIHWLGSCPQPRAPRMDQFADQGLCLGTHYEG